MVQVTEQEFWAALKADRRDIMPTTERPTETLWRLNGGARDLFGKTMPGWKNPGDPEEFWLVK